MSHSHCPPSVVAALSALLCVSALAADSAKPREGEIVGVWMGFVTPLGRFAATSPRWVVFFEDGEVYQDIPQEGLRNFDRAGSKKDKNVADYWGTYKFKDGAGQIKCGAVVTRITTVKAGQIKLDDTNYYRCPDEDGLRIEGAWTSYNDPASPDLMKLPPGKRPIFRFRKDGSFEDEGVFNSGIFDMLGDKLRGPGGSGKYEIKDFTLCLHYGDGREKHVALTGTMGLDPAKDDAILFIAQTMFTKLR